MPSNPLLRCRYKPLALTECCHACAIKHMRTNASDTASTQVSGATGTASTIPSAPHLYQVSSAGGGKVLGGKAGGREDGVGWEVGGLGRCVEPLGHTQAPVPSQYGPNSGQARNSNLTWHGTPTPALGVCSIQPFKHPRTICNCFPRFLVYCSECV